MVVCKLHIKGSREVHNWNSFYTQTVFKKKHQKTNNTHKTPHTPFFSLENSLLLALFHQDSKSATVTSASSEYSIWNW